MVSYASINKWPPWCCNRPGTKVKPYWHWWHPEKSFIDIIVSFLASIFVPLPKRFVVVPIDDKKGDSNQDLTTKLVSHVVRSREALESIHERHQKSPSGPYRVWAKLIGQDIVEATLEIPRRVELLQQWGITAAEQQHLRLAEKDTVTVHVAFPVSLLPNDVAAPKTVLGSGALELDGDVGLDCVSRILATQSAPPAVILYAHGGGFTIGTPRDSGLLDYLLGHHETSKEVPKPFVYASIKYGIAPELPFPNAPLEATSVVAWFLGRSSPKHVHMVGVSAGGGLMLSAYAGILQSSLIERPASVIALCPMLNPSCDTMSFVENETSSLVAPAPWLRWSFRCYLQMPMRVEGDGESSQLLNNHAAWQQSVWYRSSLRHLIEPEDLLKRKHCSDNVKIVITTNSADPLRDCGMAFAAAVNGVTLLEHKGSHFLGSILDKKSRHELCHTLLTTIFKSTWEQCAYGNNL